MQAALSMRQTSLSARCSDRRQRRRRRRLGGTVKTDGRHRDSRPLVVVRRRRGASACFPCRRHVRDTRVALAGLVLVGSSSHGHEKDASAGQTESDWCAGIARARDGDRLKGKRLLLLLLLRLELLLTVPSLAERAGAAALGVVTALGEARVLLVDAAGQADTTLSPGGDCALGRRRGRRGGGSGWRGWGVHGAIAHAVANWTAL